MDIRELLLELRTTPSDRAVARATGVHRETVKRYREWATAQGLLTGPLPPLEELQTLLAQTLPTLQPPQNTSQVEPYRALVAQLRQENAEIAAIFGRLQDEGFTGSYSAVRRFVRRIDPRDPRTTVRVEVAPGEEAQVDFGYVGRLLDPETGELRKAWVFVLTLSWSRHQYVEFVFDQSVATWLRLHRNAFEFLGGVPARIVVDNLKAAIVRACFDDPQVQYAYRECAEHYGFRISPCRVRTPEHKGKVEQGVHFVKRNFVAARPQLSLPQANQEVRHWIATIAGQRVHGTTKEQPLRRFEDVERARLLPLPAVPYDLAVWKLAKLHRDCYVVFEGAYYSAPFRLVGQQLLVRGGSREVRIYTRDYQLVATHERAAQAGERKTHLAHLPPEKVPGLTRDRETLRQQAAAIGPAVSEVVNRLLDDPVIDRMHTAGALVGLAERFGPARLEAACARSLRFADPAYRTVKGILTQGLETAELPALAPAPPAHAFVRPAEELVGDLTGGVSWN